MKLARNLKLFSIFLLSLSMIMTEMSCLTIKKVEILGKGQAEAVAEAVTEAETDRHKTHHHKAHTGSKDILTPVNPPVPTPGPVLGAVKATFTYKATKET
jgi:hypothetical protein